MPAHFHGFVYDCWSSFVQPMHRTWTWETLSALYSGEGRVYHTLDHIEACLTELERLPPQRGLVRPDVVALALLWHDAVYVPGNASNERLSRDLLMTMAEVRATHIERAIFERAGDAILATASHKATSSDTLDAVIDIDMAILGAKPKDYRRYCEGVRREFHNDAQWPARRSAFLTGVLSQEFIFILPSMHDQYESQARENMKHELNELHDGD